MAQAFDVSSWLHTLGLEEHLPLFQAEELTEVGAISVLTDVQLKELGVSKLAHRHTLRTEAAQLQKQHSQAGDPLQVLSSTLNNAPRALSRRPASQHAPPPPATRRPLEAVSGGHQQSSLPPPLPASVAPPGPPTRHNGPPGPPLRVGSVGRHPPPPGRASSLQSQSSSLPSLPSSSALPQKRQQSVVRRPGSQERVLQHRLADPALNHSRHGLAESLCPRCGQARDDETTRQEDTCTCGPQHAAQPASSPETPPRPSQHLTYSSPHGRTPSTARRASSQARRKQADIYRQDFTNDDTISNDEDSPHQSPSQLADSASGRAVPPLPSPSPAPVASKPSPPRRTSSSSSNSSKKPSPPRRTSSNSSRSASSLTGPLPARPPASLTRASMAAKPEPSPPRLSPPAGARGRQDSSTQAVAQPAFRESVREGWMSKLGYVRKTWRRRYFVLLRDQLLYFESYELALAQDSSRAKGSIELQGTQVRPMSLAETGGRSWGIGISTARDNRTYILAAEKEADFEGWVHVLFTKERVKPAVAAAANPLAAVSPKQPQPRFNGVFQGSRFEGYLTKQGYLRKNWKVRFFVVVGPHLLYFANEQTAAKNDPLLAKGKIEISHARLKPIAPSVAGGRGYAFGVTSSLDGTGRTYIFAAESAAEFEKWVHALFLDPAGQSLSAQGTTTKTREQKAKEAQFFAEYTKQLHAYEMERLEAEQAFAKKSAFRPDLLGTSLSRSGLDASKASSKHYGVTLGRLRDVNHKRQVFVTLEVVERGAEWYVMKPPTRPKPSDCLNLLYQGKALTSAFARKELDFPDSEPFLIPKADAAGPDKLFRACVWGTNLLNFQASTFLGMATTEPPAADAVSRTLQLQNWTGEDLPGALVVQLTDLEAVMHLEAQALQEHQEYVQQQDAEKARRIAEVNAKLDSYELGQELGRGTYGRVLLVRHRETGQEFAMKRMAKKRIKASEREAILDEMRVMQGLEHPRLNSLHEWFETGSEIIAVLELCRGGEIVERLRREYKSWSEQHTAHAIRDLVTALQYLHSRGYVHRDVKPQNLVCESENADAPCVLIDFGLTEQEGAGLHLRCGTPPYSAPELLNNAPNEDHPVYGQGVDVWAVGVMMYLFCTGKFPFWDPDDEQRRRLVTAARPDLPKTLSSELKDLLAHIFVPDPEERATITFVAEHPWFDRAPGRPLPSSVVPGVLELMDM